MPNYQYIFTMRDLRKVVPPSREILKGIYLAFFPGAKIGVIGANGAGKSSLLRIMAGVDHDFIGEARPADGIRIGYLSQEPVLDDHIPFLEQGIPSVDLIDFSYPYADTVDDTPDKLDEAVLDKVGETVSQLVINLSGQS